MTSGFHELAEAPPARTSRVDDELLEVSMGRSTHRSAWGFISGGARIWRRAQANRTSVIRLRR